MRSPLLARVYPNGPADVNHFNAAGGLGFMIDQLLSVGLLHEDVRTVWGKGLSSYAVEARLGENGAVVREPIAKVSGDAKVVTTADKPFQPNGGLKMLTGNLGKGVIKISAVKPERYVVEAPARVFDTQNEMQAAFKAGSLTGDFVAVVRFQGPKANGMPELHKLTPPLGVLQDRGQAVALVTDGRMSGASGKVPAAIHVTPEAKDGGPIARIRDGDMIRLDAVTGSLEVLVPAEEFTAREPATADLSHNEWGLGRELFARLRDNAGTADEGASVLYQRTECRAARRPRRPDPPIRLPGAHVHDVVAMVGVSAEDVDPVQFLVVEQPQEAHFDRVVGVGAGQHAADAGNPRLGNIEIEFLRQLELGQDTENGAGRRNADQLAAARRHVHDALLGVFDPGFIHCFFHLVPDLAVVHEGFFSLQIVCPRSHVTFPLFLAPSPVAMCFQWNPR